ncbi:hypothetical protein PVK06_015872 [Gossypium arboreum]|uniref:Aminotransferase-like plant mobile domain-containing protein n=1 Tax=Gossypium arboreum TaxID=29729 RepID=A0ABR0PZ47_GOSAR|nr:hypothetical protein PVK06_015872 [Gossypium arboreum]
MLNKRSKERFQPDECVIPFLELAGFGSAALIWTFDLRYDLISALVERWRPETHTFHLPCGKCIITLEDVAVQLGLPIDGNMVTGANFVHLPNTATELEVMQATRGYIIHFIGGVLVPDSYGSEMDHESGYQEVIHDSDISSDDRESFWGGGSSFGCRILFLRLWPLFPRMHTSTQTYGALAHPLSIFRRWSGIMAIEYSDSSVVYNISRHNQYDCLESFMA